MDINDILKLVNLTQAEVNALTDKEGIYFNSDTGKLEYDGSVMSSVNQGFIDYNDDSGEISIAANTWVNIPNDGQGAYSNDSYKPDGVTKLMDVSTGAIDTSELSLGDSIIVRNDFTVIPKRNNCKIEFRYSLGAGLGSYTLETNLGRLDNGSGTTYRFALKPDLIYMGDSNTKDNPIVLQIKLSTKGKLTNAGTVIQVLKREV